MLTSFEEIVEDLGNNLVRFGEYFWDAYTDKLGD